MHKILLLLTILMASAAYAGEPWDSAHAPEKVVKLLTGQDVNPEDVHVEEGAPYDAASSSFMEGKQKVALVVLHDIHACRVIILANDKLSPGQVRIKEMDARLQKQAKIAKRTISVGDDDQEFEEVLIDGKGFSGLGERICCGCSQALAAGGVPLNHLDAKQTKTEAITIEVHPETQVKFAGLHTHFLGFLPEGMEQGAAQTLAASVLENSLELKNRASRIGIFNEVD